MKITQPIKYTPYLADNDEQIKSRQDKIDMFIISRARGVSYDAISKETGVSKPTLIKWSRQYEVELNNLRIVEQEALVEELSITKENRLKLLSNQYNKIAEELDKRSLEGVPTRQLMAMLTNLSSEIDKLTTQNKFSLVDEVDTMGLLSFVEHHKVEWNA